MEETKVKDYLYDYKKSSFKTVNNSGKKNYYIKINQDYIEKLKMYIKHVNQVMTN